MLLCERVSDRGLLRKGRRGIHTGSLLFHDERSKLRLRCHRARALAAHAAAFSAANLNSLVYKVLNGKVQ